VILTNTTAQSYIENSKRSSKVMTRRSGLAEVYIREDKPDPARIQRKYGHLQSLIVTEQSRKQGIGKRLVGEAEKWAKHKGAKEMQLDIWEFGEGPLKFHERCGYRTLRRTLVREL